MSAQEFVLGKLEMLKLDAARDDTVRVRSGDVWLTRHNDPNDHIMKASHAMPLNGTGLTLITACQPTLLELYRQNPAAVRKAVECQAHRARNEAIHAIFARLFC
jgi:hypothetical protein